METATLLRKTVAEFFEVDEGQVGPSFSLQARQGSIARAALDAAIRGRVGVKSSTVYSARTFGELMAEVAPGSSMVDGSVSVVEVAPVAIASTSGASCGVDLELIENLPVAADPWEHDFYRAMFSPGEIAFCLRQPEPSTHFAARWCAKEALKKADRAFLAVEMKEIEVVHDESGAPHLEYNGGGTSRRLPHAVSLSHTTHAAVAVVVKVDASPTPISSPILPPTAPIPVLPSARSRPSKFLLALNLLAVALALFALARTFPILRWPFAG